MLHGVGPAHVVVLGSLTADAALETAVASKVPPGTPVLLVSDYVGRVWPVFQVRRSDFPSLAHYRTHVRGVSIFN